MGLGREISTSFWAGDGQVGCLHADHSEEEGVAICKVEYLDVTRWGEERE